MMNALLLLSLFMLVAIVSGYDYYRKDHGNGGHKFLSNKFLSKDYTTAIKGLAMILIILGHLSWSWTRFFTPFGGIGVALFLIVSGYGLNVSYQKYGLTDFWRKRFLLVYVPWFMTANVLALWKEMTVQTYLLNILCVQTNLWFVSYIVQVYFIYWLVLKFFPKYRLQLLGTVSILSFLLLPVLQAEQSLSFISGVWLAESKNINQFLGGKKKLYAITVSSLFVGLLALSLKQIPMARDIECPLLLNFFSLLIKWPIAVALLLLPMIVRTLVLNPFLVFTGTISYELYLVHQPLQNYCDGPLWKGIAIVLFAYFIAFIFNIINKGIMNRHR